MLARLRTFVLFSLLGLTILVFNLTVMHPASAAGVDLGQLIAGSVLGTDTSGTIKLTWGTYVAAVLTYLEPIVTTILMMVAAWFSRGLPGWLGLLASEWLTQQRIARAVHYAVTQIDGAVVGKTSEVKAASGLAGVAEEYMFKLAPVWAKDLGDRLRPMILSKISQLGMAPAAAVKDVAPLPKRPLSQKALPVK